jgi:hypothetical protein
MHNLVMDVNFNICYDIIITNKDLNNKYGDDID